MFADLLVELRLARGLSQEALAARAAVSVRAISDLERAMTRRPHRETVRALADGLALDAGERDRFERRRPGPPAAGTAGRPRCPRRSARSSGALTTSPRSPGWSATRGYGW